MKNFLNVFCELHRENLGRLAEIYADDVRFVDPAHTIDGLEQLTRYFENLYRNIDPPVFRFLNDLRLEAEGYVQWEMDFSHPRLSGGKVITVSGSSYIRFNDEGKVFFHRDYFDLGAMLYERLPLIGRIIGFIKGRLGA